VHEDVIHLQATALKKEGSNAPEEGTQLTAN